MSGVDEEAKQVEPGEEGAQEETVAVAPPPAIKTAVAAVVAAADDAHAAASPVKAGDSLHDASLPGSPAGPHAPGTLDLEHLQTEVGAIRAQGSLPEQHPRPWRAPCTTHAAGTRATSSSSWALLGQRKRGHTARCSMH